MRSSSLLPEPVVPASRQCGPSAARSTSNGPASPTPMGADRPAGGELADHRAAMADAKPSTSSPSAGAFGKSSRRTRSGSREPGAAASGSSRRARLRAAASATPSATPAVSKATAAAPRPGRRRRAGGPVSTTSAHPAGSNSGFSSSHSPAAGRPAPKRISRKARRCSSGRRGWSAVIIVTGAEPAGRGDGQGRQQRLDLRRGAGQQPEIGAGAGQSMRGPFDPIPLAGAVGYDAHPHIGRAVGGGQLA